MHVLKKKLCVFLIFLEMYKEMMSGSRLLHSIVSY